MVVTELVLFDGTGSVTPGGGVIVTVLTSGASGAVVGAVARTVITTLPPDGKRGTLPLMRPPLVTSGMALQSLVPVPAVPVQIALTLVSPAGRVSLNVVPSAALRPLLIRVMV